MAIAVISVLLSLMASAFCSISEAAFYAFPQSAVEHLRKKGSLAGRYLHHLKENMERTIAAVLVMNTIANTAGVFLATKQLEGKLTPTQDLLFVAFLTILILLFGEIVPKTIGVKQTRLVAPLVSIPFYWVLRILEWVGLIWIIQRLTKRMTGQGKQQEFRSEDMYGLAEIGVREGIIDKQQAMVIKNILDLKTMSARGVMTPRQVVFTLPVDMTIDQAIQHRGNWPFSRIPLHGTNKDEWQGVILRRDAYNLLAEGKGNTSLRKLMRPLQMVPDSVTLDKLLHRFLKQRGHIVGVVDEYGTLAGIATLEDVLEGILGREIVDEFDEAIDLQDQARRKSIALAAINLRHAAQGRVDPDD